MNSHEHQSIRNGLQMHRHVLEDNGLVVSVQQDGLQQWQALVADAPTVANWCFRPDRQPDITAGNTLSFLVRDRATGAPAAAIALRLYEAFEDLVDLVESGRMWFSVSRALEVAPPEIYFPDDFPRAQGRIFQLGGLVVWPGFQGKRIGWHLVRMIRWAGFQLFNADHSVGLEMPKMAETHYMPLEYYGYQRVIPVDIDVNSRLDSLAG